MEVAADWSVRGEYIAKHGLTPAMADEALADASAHVLDPDPASRSGVSVRTIGWSDTFGGLVTVITVFDEGRVWGINAWPSSDRDIRKYDEQE